MTQYKVSFTAFVSNPEGTERHIRPGWLIVDLDEDMTDEEVATYAAWDSDSLVDVDFIEPGDHWPSASHENVVGGEGCRVEDDETFFSAVITKIERSSPLKIDGGER